MNYDLKVVCLNFNLPTKGTKKNMDRNSFEMNVHNNPEFRQDLRAGKLFGLYTHAGRYYDKLDKTIPYADNISKHPDIANYIVEEEIVGDEVHLSLKLIDGPNKRGTLVKELLRQGVDVGVSMSTHCDPLKTDAYYITKLLGIDFTMDPAFIGTGVIEQNFSAVVGTSILGGTGQPEIVNFCMPAKIIDSRIPKGDIYQIPFAEDYIDKTVRYDNYLFDKESLNFSKPTPEQLDREVRANPQNFALLKQMIVEAKFPPYRRLQRRIDELIREVKGKPEEFIEQHKDIYFQFINDPIYNWISKAFSSDKKVMLNIGLRLNKYVKNPSVVTMADRKIEQIRKRRKTMKGVFDRNSQKQLDEVLKQLFGEIWKYIEQRSNTVLISKEEKAEEGAGKEGVKTMLRNYDNMTTSYRSIEEWLDAGSDGVKDYNIWIRSFPYSAKDKDNYKDGYYGYKEVDDLIKALANNSLDEQGKSKLAKMMEEQNINHFSYRQFNDEEITDISRRTITDADVEAIADKITEDKGLLDKFVNKLKEKGAIPGGDNQEGMPPVDAPDTQPQEGELPPPPPEEELPPPPEEQPQQPEGQQVDTNRFPKPKVITSHEASKLTGVNFSSIKKIPKKLTREQSRKLISFSVVEMIEPNCSGDDLDVVWFSLGRPNGLSRQTVKDILVAKRYFSNGALSPEEYQVVKNSLIANIL